MTEEQQKPEYSLTDIRDRIHSLQIHVNEIKHNQITLALMLLQQNGIDEPIEAVYSRFMANRQIIKDLTGGM